MVVIDRLFKFVCLAGRENSQQGGKIKAELIISIGNGKTKVN
jgi:hypothetical protein